MAKEVSLKCQLIKIKTEPLIDFINRGENQVSKKNNRIEIAIYPNTSTYDCTIAYRIPEDSLVKLQLYGLNGNLESTVFQSSHQAAGSYQIQLETLDLPNGIYFLNIQLSTRTHLF